MLRALNHVAIKTTRDRRAFLELLRANPQLSLRDVIEFGCAQGLGSKVTVAELLASSEPAGPRECPN